MVDVFSPVTAAISHILTQTALATQAVEISGKFMLICMWDLTIVRMEDLVHIFYPVVPRTESREIHCVPSAIRLIQFWDQTPH